MKMPLLRRCVICFVYFWITGDALAQQGQGAAAAQAGFELVLKQPFPDLAFVSVTFSSNERYAMMLSLSNVVVYDVKSAIEVRRFTLADTQQPFMGAFYDSKPDTLDVSTKNGVLQCDLASGAACSLLSQQQAAKLNTQALFKHDPSMQTYGFNSKLFGDAMFTKPLNVWKSPSGKMELYTRMMPTGQVVLYVASLSHGKPAGAPAILGGSDEALTSIHTYPVFSLLKSRGKWTHNWDFRTAEPTTYVADGVYSVDGGVAYYFGVGKPAKLYRQAAGEATKDTGYSSFFQPAWFGTSTKGEVVILKAPEFLPSSKLLSVVRDGKATDVDCDTPGAAVLDPRLDHVEPSIDASGAVLIAFCDSKMLNAFHSTKLVVWSLPDMKMTNSIAADDFTQWSSIAPYGKTAVMGKGSAARIVDLATGAARDISLPLISPTDTVAAGELQSDGKTMVFARNSFSAGHSNIVWLDTTTGKSFSSVDMESIRALSTDTNGAATVLGADNVIRLFDAQGTPLARFISIGTNDWMIFSESGFFDGTPNALKWVSVKLPGSALPVPVESLFSELYLPGLFRLLSLRQFPQLPQGINYSVYLDVPGIRGLLLQGVQPSVVQGKAALCFSDVNLFQGFKEQYGGPNVLMDGDPQCPNRVVFSNQDDPAATVQALAGLKSVRGQATPWDGQHITDAPAQVHLFTAAVSNYPESELPAIPTAVPGSKQLQQAIASTYGADKVTLWGDAKCNGLYDGHATKAGILKCLDSMIAAVKPEDIAVLVFAGHGGTGAQGPTQSDLFQFFTARDPQVGDMADDSISAIEFAERLRKIKARRVVLVMDACESGLTMAPLISAMGAKIQQDIVSVALAQQPGAAPPPMPPAEGVLLLAASSGLENALTSATDNPFLNSLLEILKNEPNAASSYAIATKMAQPLTLQTADGGTQQSTPVAIAIGADFAVLGH